MILWRLLDVGEIIDATDEYWRDAGREWLPMTPPTVGVGLPVVTGSEPFRRPIDLPGITSPEAIPAAIEALEMSQFGRHELCRCDGPVVCHLCSFYTAADAALAALNPTEGRDAE